MEEQKNSKSLIITIIIAIILAAGCGVGGYYLGGSKQEETAPEVKQDEKQEEISEKTGNIVLDEPKKVIINDKEVTLKIELSKKADEDSQNDNYKITFNNIELCNNSSEEYQYTIFKSSDGKEYMLLGTFLYLGPSFDMIINDEGKVLTTHDYTIISHNPKADGYNVTQDGKEVSELEVGKIMNNADVGSTTSPAIIDDGNVYFPVLDAKYLALLNIGGYIIAPYTKVTINNNEIKEEDTDIFRLIFFTAWV